MTEQQLKQRHVTILEALKADLTIPLGAQAIVLFAHGSDSSRHSSRNQFVANVLNKKGIATLLVDLLSQEEKRIDEDSGHIRYNIELLTARFTEVTKWLAQQPETRDLKIGYFGSSTGAAAALTTAAKLGAAKAIVTREGRPDLARESAIHQVKAPTLFIVGGNDIAVIARNKRALELLSDAEVKEIAIIPGATHLFEEPGKIEEVAQITADWFECYLLETRKSKFYNKNARITGRGFLSTLRGKYDFQIKFRDRFGAGQILASMLGKYKDNLHGVTVLGIARGGVAVADPIAEKLNADLDIIVSRKLRSPHNSENAIGAIMHDGSVYLGTSSLKTQHGISDEYIAMEISMAMYSSEIPCWVFKPEVPRYTDPSCMIAPMAFSELCGDLSFLETMISKSAFSFSAIGSATTTPPLAIPNTVTPCRSSLYLPSTEASICPAANRSLNFISKTCFPSREEKNLPLVILAYLLGNLLLRVSSK